LAAHHPSGPSFLYPISSPLPPFPFGFISILQQKPYSKTDNAAADEMLTLHESPYVEKDQHKDTLIMMISLRNW